MTGTTTTTTAVRPRLWRRILQHLIRRTAILCALGVAVAAIIALLAGSSSAVGQVSLVAIGTLFSLALLPDEPHRLWNVTAQSMAETIPPQRLSEAGGELVRAISLQQGGILPGDVVGSLWRAQFHDLELAATNPSRVVRNVDYRIRVERSAPAGTGGGPVLEMMSLETDLSSDRHIPDSDVVFISFCSNLDALSREFDVENCMLRELVPQLPLEPPGRWAERLKAFTVTLKVGGADRQFLRHEVVNLGSADSYVIRFVFDAGSIRKDYTSCRIHTRFQSQDDGVFDVKFSSYYAVGHTNIEFEIRDHDVQLEFSEFMSTSARSVTERPSISSEGQRIEVSTQDDAVLPPGSGVTFRWSAGVPQLLRPPRAQMHAVPEQPALPPDAALPQARADVDPDTNAEALEPLRGRGVDVFDAYAALGVLPTRDLRVRSTVLRRLQQADDLLPPGYSLVVLDAWRSLADQRALVEHYPSAAVQDHYIADPDSRGMRPPHTTGGAVDLTLSWSDEPLALGTDFDSFDRSAHLSAFEQIDGTTRRLRRLLARVLLEAGFAPYPLEWWHWSYGDDVWRSYHDAPRALYEVIPE